MSSEVQRAVLGLVLLACGCGAPGQPQAALKTPPARLEPRSEAVEVSSPLRSIVEFRGTCDASGAVALGGTLFVVGDDEDNVLRVYDGAVGGDPIAQYDMSPALDLAGDAVPEADIEAATRLGDRALWLTSHGLSGTGMPKPSRFCFFASSAPMDGMNLVPVGTAYHDLLADMIRDPGLARFDLTAAAVRPPREPGGLNIEGMTRRIDGTSVLIGFRNPVPEGKALLVPLLNPLRVIEGEHAQFGPPQLLDLGGLGIRSLTVWRGRYLIAAGPIAHETSSRLYVWDGANALHEVKGLKLDEVNPEGFVSRDENDEVMLLSDDGTMLIDGQPCKLLQDRSRKLFRGVNVRVPDNP